MVESLIAHMKNLQSECRRYVITIVARRAAISRYLSERRDNLSSRPRKALNPLAPKPDFDQDDLLSLADRLSSDPGSRTP